MKERCGSVTELFSSCDSQILVAAAVVVDHLNGLTLHSLTRESTRPQTECCYFWFLLFLNSKLICRMACNQQALLNVMIGPMMRWTGASKWRRVGSWRVFLSRVSSVSRLQRFELFFRVRTDNKRVSNGTKLLYTEVDVGWIEKKYFRESLPWCSFYKTWKTTQRSGAP